MIVRDVVPVPLVDAAGDYLRQHNHRIDEKGQFPVDVRLAKPVMAIPQFLYSQSLYSQRPIFGFLGAKRFYMHLPPMARAVLPGADMALWSMHADTEYNGHITGDFCTVWVPLVPIDHKCGGLATPRRRFVPMKPGDVVILGCKVLHKSMPNKSEFTRLSVDYRFWGEGTTSSKHYLDMASGEVVAPHA